MKKCYSQKAKPAIMFVTIKRPQLGIKREVICVTSKRETARIWDDSKTTKIRLLKSEKIIIKDVLSVLQGLMKMCYSQKAKPASMFVTIKWSQLGIKRKVIYVTSKKETDPIWDDSETSKIRL